MLPLPRWVACVGRGNIWIEIKSINQVVGWLWRVCVMSDLQSNICFGQPPLRYTSGKLNCRQVTKDNGFYQNVSTDYERIPMYWFLCGLLFRHCRPTLQFYMYIRRSTQFHLALYVAQLNRISICQESFRLVWLALSQSTLTRKKFNLCALL